MRHGRKSASRKFDGYKMDVMTEEHTELVLGVESHFGTLTPETPAGATSPRSLLDLVPKVATTEGSRT